MSHYLQRISIDPASEREWWVGWEIEGSPGEIPGLIPADGISELELRAKGVTEFRKVTLPLLERVERRRAFRVHLDPPMRGMLGPTGVDIVDLSCAGAGIVTIMPILAGRRLRLDFDHKDEMYSIPFDVLRCSASSMSQTVPVYYVALRLVEDGTSVGSLRRLIAGIRVRMLRNNSGDWGVYSESELVR